MDQPYFRTDYFGPPGDTNFISPEQERREHQAAVAAASREASQRETAYLRALGTPRTLPELPLIKEPILSPDFAQRVQALDEEIYRKGVAIDADKLLALGKERFQQLFELDRKAPRGSIGAGVDLTSFESVQLGLHAFESSAVPARKTREQVAGSGKEREQVRRISSFDDLWKFTAERREVIDDIYNFRDAFESLLFGQSLLDKLSSDGHVRSRFFTGGKGQRVELLRDWLSVVEGSLASVTLAQPLWHLISWLANERTPTPSSVDLARDFFNIRAPSSKQVALVQAVLDGFLLDYREWPLWEYVGRRTRAIPDESRLATWRSALAARYPRISAFHAEIRTGFLRDVGYGYEAHHQFEADRHRRFLDRTVQKLLDCMSAVLALGIEETFSGAVVARFQGAALVESKRKLADKRVSLGLPLAKAFSSASFPIAFEEVQQP